MLLSALVALANESGCQLYCGRSADGCRYLGDHHPEVRFTRGRQGLPHRAVRLRDGIRLVGPLVIPGMTSCLVTPLLLRCALLRAAGLFAVGSAAAVYVLRRELPMKDEQV